MSQTQLKANVYKRLCLIVLEFYFHDFQLYLSPHNLTKHIF